MKTKKRVLRTPELIIMDFDGTIVDSKRVLCDLTAKTLNRFRLSVPPQEIERLIGKLSKTRLLTHRIPEKRIGAALDYFNALHALSEYDEAELVPGFENWLKTVANIEKWIVSNSPSNPVNSFLERHKISHHFSRIITRNAQGPISKVEILRREVGNSFLRPVWCFGDEPDDLIAGFYVGAITFLIVNEYNIRYRLLADFTIRNFTDFEEELNRSCQTRGTEEYTNALIMFMNSLNGDVAEYVTQQILSISLGDKRVFFAANGGSLSVVRHFAIDLRKLMVAVKGKLDIRVLGIESETLTAFGNDIGWEDGLWQEICLCGRPGDLLIILTTSGVSKNLQKLYSFAKTIGITTT